MLTFILMIYNSFVLNINKNKIKKKPTFNFANVLFFIIMLVSSVSSSTSQVLTIL